MKTKRTFSLSQKGKVLAFCLGEKTKAFMPTSFLARAAMTLLLAVLTATTAWADAVNLSVDNDIAEGTAGHWYVNMPKTGTNTLTLSDASVTTFKVYDDGGKSNNYSKYCSGTLVLTAPTGYLLQLSGSITTEWYDKLTVYDGSTTDAAKLLDGVSSADNGSQTAITTVISSGQSMTLYFYSDDAVAYAGLNLTVTLISANAELGITVDNATGGCVVATVGGTSATTAKTNDVVTLAATPESGYVLSGISVTDASTNPVAVTWDGMFSNTATFTMPGTAVTVTPTFTNDLANIYINMPWTGMQTVAIPSNVTSLKVYDNGGKSGNYSNKCDGTLVLTAPTGYLLQLSGSITTESSYDYLSVYDGSDDGESGCYFGLSCKEGEIGNGATYHDLTIYGQAAGTGKVSANHGHPGYATSYAYYAKNITINGGVVEATNTGNGISGSNITINGGQILLPNYAEIRAGNSIVLGWRKPSDFIQAYRFVNPGGSTTIQIADGKVFTDGTGIYDNTTTTGTLESLTNVTLHPISGVTLTKVGENLSATLDGTSNVEVSIPADVTVTSVTYNRAFTAGEASTIMLPFSIDVANTSGADFYTYTGVNYNTTTNKWEATMTQVSSGTLAANTPYLVVPTGTAITFTGGVTLNTTGRRLNGKPTKKGLYIHNGRKEVLK